MMQEDHWTKVLTEFNCNICGAANRHAGKPLDREQPSCSSCGSSVRTRGLLRVLSLELFGLNLALPDFPRVKSLRGLGISDSNPRFDVTNPPRRSSGNMTS